MSAATTDFPARTNPRILALFDVDGTLTIPRGEVTDDMLNFMKELSTHVVVGIVGGMWHKIICCMDMRTSSPGRRCSTHSLEFLVLIQVPIYQNRKNNWEKGL
jgi:hypothetical protein